MRTKFIVTNLSVLERKYNSGFDAIRRALRRLIKADEERGIETTVFDVSDETAMKKAGGKAVTRASNSRQNKEAVDAIYTSASIPPDYLLLLGSIDVIPHQDLINPLFGADDPDEHAWGDLPYACDAPYSQQISDFTKPSRVVGRLPDIQGRKNVDYFVKLIDNAASWVSLAPASYSGYFAVSARTWQRSTKLSIRKTFGAAKDVLVSPTSGPVWQAADLAPLAHFINCHGASGRSEFYGEDPNGRGSARYPIAHQTVHVRNLIQAGTVAAVECCYGAELYKPTKAIDPERGICQEYLHDDAYGFFGSTTIAYGPADSNGAADIICSAFLRHVRAGDSLGVAALAARQDFIKACDLLDPVDQKTLAQFNLLGDPSIHPVHTAATATSDTLVKAKSSRKALTAAKAGQPRLDEDYRERRKTLRENAPKLAARLTIASKKVEDPKMDAKARRLARAAGIRPTGVKTFTVEPPLKAAPSAKKAFSLTAAPAAAKICVVTGSYGKDASSKPSSKAKGLVAEKPPVSSFVVAVMRQEANGTLKIIRRVFSKYHRPR